MEKLEVGQVWTGDGQRRKITKIVTAWPGGIADIRYSRMDAPNRCGAMFEPNFQKWIARTGAKLEGRGDDANR